MMKHYSSNAFILKKYLKLAKYQIILSFYFYIAELSLSTDVRKNNIFVISKMQIIKNQCKFKHKCNFNVKR